MKDIITFRDDREGVLLRPTEKIKRFDRSLALFAEEMQKIMEKKEGLGLAAPQVGVSKAICVVKWRKEIYFFCNPEIKNVSGDKELMEEGCLSFPGIFLEVPRWKQVEVEYQDLKGKKKKLKTEGLFARAIQHEADHLSGVVFTSRAK